jgi:hypothetical protein
MASLFQFSIRGLLWAVTFLAVGMAALLNANGLWQGLSWGLAIYALTAAILLAVYRREEMRAFWLGFAVFGWLYLLMFLTSQAPAQFQFWVRSDPLRYQDLFATQLAQWSHQNLLPETRRVAQIEVTLPPGPSMTGMSSGPGDMDAMMGGASGPPGGMPGAGGMMPGGMMASMMGGMGPMGGVAMAPNPSYVPIEYFQQIFHALALLLVAAVGGKTCQIIYRTRPREEQ